MQGWRIRIGGMDPVRLGRALGMGTREIAKTLVKAGEAVVAPNPGELGRKTARGVVQARAGVVQAKTTAAGVKRGGKRFGEAVWGPMARLSGVLWLELTGVFFGLFALTAGMEVWKRRADFGVAGEPRQHAWFAVGMLAVFGWFMVTSFVRAARRGRRDG